MAKISAILAVALLLIEVTSGHGLPARRSQGMNSLRMLRSSSDDLGWTRELGGEGRPTDPVANDPRDAAAGEQISLPPGGSDGDDEEGDDSVREVTPPSWSKPERMGRDLLVEPVNSGVILRCPAQGSPTPTIRWIKDGVPIESVRRPAHLARLKEKKEKFQLRIPRLTYSDQGNYTCVVSNDAGPKFDLTHTFTLEVQTQLDHTPQLAEQSNNLTVLEGMTARMHCRFTADVAVIVHWVQPSEKWSDDPSVLAKEESANAFESILDTDGEAIKGDYFVIENVTKEDAGTYFCVGATERAMKTGVFILTVLDITEAILEPPHNVTAAPGAEVVFSCRTRLEMHALTSWVKVEDDLVVLAEGTEVLRVENVSAHDAGAYACVVGDGKAYVEAVAFLAVQEEAIGGGLEVPVMPIGTLASKEEHRRLTLFAGLVSATAVIFLLALAYAWRRVRQERRKKRAAIASAHSITQWTKKVIVERQAGHFDPDSPILAPVIRIEKHHRNSGAHDNRSRLGSENTTLTTISEYELPLDPEWEFPRSKLKLGRTLGEGAFGKVVQAEAFGLIANGVDASGSKATTVAVKMLKEGHTDQDMIDLVSEMDMMKVIGRHDNIVNIVNLLGVCTQDGPLYVLVEYAEHGNLRDFLRSFHGGLSVRGETSFSTQQNFTPQRDEDGYEKPKSSAELEKTKISCRQLMSFAWQVSKGMEFLVAKKCIHRDLAARNVLVARGLVAKIADFGLARDVAGHDYYRKTGDGRLPVKWMAPETLFQRRYTTQSDVWSFGILLWEIATLGAQPYPSVPNVEKLLGLLRDGHRMDRPTGCPLEVYTLMRVCWNDEPSLRPTFPAITDKLNSLIIAGSDYLDVSFPVISNPDGTSSSSNSSCSKSTDSQATMICNNSGNNNPRCSSPVKYTQTSLSYSYEEDDMDACYNHHYYENRNMNRHENNTLSTFVPSPPPYSLVSTFLSSPPPQTHQYANYNCHEGPYCRQPPQPVVSAATAKVAFESSVTSSASSMTSSTATPEDMLLENYGEQYYAEHLQSSAL